jgi:hypothetical protein
MADVESEMRQLARHVVDLLENQNTKNLLDYRVQAQADALRELVKQNTDAAFALLKSASLEAPLSFEKIWPTAQKAVLNHGNDAPGAVRRLGLLLGWAYFESAWYSQTTGRQSLELSGSQLARLAGIQLGLPDNASELDVITAIFTHSTLISNIVLHRFEQGVKGGLEQINKLDARIANWETHFGEIESRNNDAEAKIVAWEETLKKYRVAFGFLGMAAAYKEFFSRKSTERNWWGGALVVLFIAILAIPPVAYHVVIQDTMSWIQLAKYGPF